jgi:hypothetical protein
MNRLVELVLTADGEVNDDVAGQIVSQLPRSELKAFLAGLRLELKRRTVRVALAGQPGGGLGEAVARAWPGKKVDVEADETLGAGIRVSAGDDIMDASMHGYIREIIEELGGT